MAIFLFSGPSCTGKSTLAQDLGKKFQLPVLGEREILHTLASSHGFSRTRYWLAEDGINKVLDEALEETIRRIKTEKNELGVILDGSYDCRLPKTLAENFKGEKIFIISVIAEEKTRKERMTKRMNTNLEEALNEMHFIDRFKYLAGMGEIIKEANLVIKNEQPIGETLREIQPILESELSFRPYGPERM